MEFTRYIVIVNAALVGLALAVAGRYLARGSLTAGVPGTRQNMGEAVVSFFLGKARDMSHEANRHRVVRSVTPVLGTFFLFILLSNVIGVFPVPLLNRPPTSFFGATLALAICAVGATFILSVVFKGAGGALKHLVWPNPLQWVSELTDVLSLSLRLFGNIGGEYLTFSLVALYVPVGIPLILHVFGLIPVFVQALVFTLLTASYLSAAVATHAESHADEAEAAAAESGAGGQDETAQEIAATPSPLRGTPA